MRHKIVRSVRTVSTPSTRYPLLNTHYCKDAKMKKYLLILWIMVLGQSAFGMDILINQDTLVQQDSVVIEFGKSGKLVIFLGDQEDYERLKELDINGIVEDLELELDEATGEITVVELRQFGGTKEIIRIRENGPETRVSVGRLKVVVDDSGEKKEVNISSTPRKKRLDPAFRTYGTFDLGLNNYLEKGNRPGGGAVYGVKGWGSWNVGLHWMASHRVEPGKNWDFGLGVQWYNFKFENKGYQTVNGENGVEFIHRTDVNGFKSKISASYLTLLTMFRWDFAKMNNSEKKGVRLAAGPYFGYRLGGRSKFVYKEWDGSGRKKDREPIGNNLNDFRVGLRGEVGYRSLTLFATYDLNTLFQKDRGPSLHPIAFGVVF